MASNSSTMPPRNSSALRFSRCSSARAQLRGGRIQIRRRLGLRVPK
jgi:hypothetical protein